MKKHSDVRVRFRILEFSKAPEIFAAEVGVPADKIWRAGERIGKSGRGPTYQSNGWMIVSSLGADHSVGDHVLALLDRMKPAWGFLREIANDCYIELAITVVMYSGAEPELGFDAGLLRRLAEINANIDVDLMNR